MLKYLLKLKNKENNMFFNKLTINYAKLSDYRFKVYIDNQILLAL